MQAIAIRADKNIVGYTQYTIPIIEKFCKKWDATLEYINEPPPVMTDDNKPHYRIMQVHDLLDKYDRVLCLDADMLILPNCPNPFDEVPEDKIGTIFEDKGTRRPTRLKYIQDIQRSWGNVGWTQHYSNAGTFMVSKKHQYIFTDFEGKYWTAWGSADVHLSFQGRRFNHQFHELSFKWNHMTMFSESWNNNADRFNSYIIHYAGRGIFDASNRIEQIKKDIKTAYENGI